MTWVLIVGLAAAAFALAAFVLRLPRDVWALLAAALLFGLAGYALQGSPGQAGVSVAARAAGAPAGPALIETRRSFFDTVQMPSRWVVTGDGFARAGRYGDAAGLYRNAITDSPRDVEAWTALGIALVEHADGNLTPAALTAFERAQILAPANGAPRFFLGIAWLRVNQPERTAQLWREALERGSPDAAWRGAVAARLGALENLMAEPEAPTATP